MIKNYSIFVLAMSVLVSAGCQSEPELDFERKKVKQSYAAGHRFGTKIKTTYADLDYSVLVRGIDDALNGIEKLTPEEVNSTIETYQVEKLEAYNKKVDAYNAKVRAKNKADKFMATNKKKPGIVTMENGIQYRVLKKGTGKKKPEYTSKVKVNYVGRLTSGMEFDRSEEGNPREFKVMNVVKGWSESLIHMVPGDKWELYIPPSLGYGGRGKGDDIGPYEPLIFEVELVEIN